MRALGRGNESRHHGAAGAKETYMSGDLLHDWPVGDYKRGEKAGGWGRERNSASEPDMPAFMSRVSKLSALGLNLEEELVSVILCYQHNA